MRPRVVLIDSGLDPSAPGVRGRGHLLPGVVVAADGSITVEPTHRDELGHGTAVAAVILSHMAECELVPIRVFQREPHCTVTQLDAALRHASSFAPTVVNVSLGLLDEQGLAVLTASIATLTANQCRVTAPLTASGIPCLPGSIPIVDAVVADPNQPRGAPRRQLHGNREIWFASPDPPPGLHGMPAAVIRGDSLATAEVSAWLLRSS